MRIYTFINGIYNNHEIVEKTLKSSCKTAIIICKKLLPPSTTAKNVIIYANFHANF